MAYQLKEDFRSIDESSTTVTEGKERFEKWLTKAQFVYGQILQTIRTHLPEICNYFIGRTTSGVMEGINNRIKLIKRQAYGFWLSWICGSNCIERYAFFLARGAETLVRLKHKLCLSPNTQENLAF